MLPSAVNDTMRDMMAQIRDVGDGIRGGTYTMTAPVITGGSITGVALSGNTLTNPVITGGSINNTTVGATTASTGAFTTLSASSTATLNTLVSSGATLTGGSINGMAIGGSTAAAGNFTTLGATGVATFSAGTVSAPAITTTGDTNTGIFFPAADTIAFAEGGVEAMRITSTGAVGIGTSSPSSFFTVDAGSNQEYFRGSGNSGSARSLIFTASTTTNAGDTHNFNASSSTGVLSFSTFNIERMRITSTGNVGIGTTSIGSKLVVAGGIEMSAVTATVPSYGMMIVSGVGNQITSALNTTFYNNGSERMRITSDGNVGIGTSSPNTNLEIRTSVDPILRLNNSTNTVTSGADIGEIQFYTNDASTSGTGIKSFIKTLADSFGANQGGASLTFGTAAYGVGDASEKMRLDRDGNLGLGVTPSAWLSTIKAFDVNAVGALWGFASGSNVQTGVTNNAFLNSSSQYIYKTSATASNYLQNQGSHIWFNAPSGTAGNAITFTQAMTLNASGNLGVGTTSPAQKLDVTGGIRSSNGGNENIFITGGTNTASIQQTSTGLYFNSNTNTTGGSFLWRNTSSYTTVMTLNANGALVLQGGTTSASGVGVAFPATQSASSDANTLDDYEEGTWTPTVLGSTTAGTTTYTTQVGTYTKVGNMVYCQGLIIWTAGTGTGNLRFGGLPFTSINASNNIHSVYFGVVDNITLTASNILTAVLPANSSTIIAYQTPAGGGGYNDVAFDGAGYVAFGITYRTA
jgi:hypothetical protein